MKKYVSLLLAVLLVLTVMTVSGCSKKTDNKDETTAVAVESTTAEGETAETVTGETLVVDIETGETVVAGSQPAQEGTTAAATTAPAATTTPAANSTAPATTAAAAQTTNNGFVTLVAEKTTVKPGETVRIKLHVADCSMFASCSGILTVEGDAKITALKKGSGVSDVYDDSGILSGEKSAEFAAFVATTTDVSDKDLFYIDITVDSSASGTIRLSANLTNWDVGLDAAGNKLSSELGRAGSPAVAITVK